MQSELYAHSAKQIPTAKRSSAPAVPPNKYPASANDEFTTTTTTSTAAAATTTKHDSTDAATDKDDAITHAAPTCLFTAEND